MTPGKVARAILGPTTFARAGRLYRSIFVDLAKVAICNAPFFPAGAHVLDVGGGDGEPLNELLRLRPDMSASMIDIGDSVGDSIGSDVISRVTRLPQTTVREYFERGNRKIDGLMICDVVHHILKDARSDFFADLRTGLRDQGPIPIVIKDVEPGSFVALLGLLADRYITGDRNVSQISRAELTSILREHFAERRVVETDLFSVDRPNYSLAILA